MLKNLKSAAVNSLIYSFGNLSTKIVGLILIPIYGKHLTIAEYGILGVLEATSYAIVVLFGFQLFIALFRWYWDKEYQEKQKSMFFTIMSFLFFSNIGICLVLLPFSSNISNLLFDTLKYSYLIKLTIISSALQVITYNPGILMRLQERAFIYMYTSTARLIVNLVITIILIVHFHHGVEGIFEAQILGSLIYLLMIIPFLLKNIEFKFNKELLIAMLIFSSPTILSGISSIVINITDRYFLNFSSGLDNAGLYSFGFKLANTVNVLVGASINMAITPMVFKMMNDKDNKRFYSKTLTYTVFVLIFISLFFAAYGKEMIKVLTHNVTYWPAFQVMPVICFAVIIGNMRDTLMNSLNILKKTKTIALILIVTSIVNVFLNAILIPTFDYMGAALALLLTQIIAFFMMYHFAQKHYPIPFETKKLFYMLLLYCAISSGTYALNNSTLTIRLIFKTILIFSFPVALYYLHFYEQVELERIKGFFQKWLNYKNLIINLKRFPGSENDSPNR